MTDYDLTDIPAGYDRGRDHGPEFLDLWMKTIESCLDGRAITRILDVGCGTGRFSEALALRFDADVIGIDPSAKMLALARAKRRTDRVHYQRAHAEAIPLAPRSVDMIFMSMSFHHFSDPHRATEECRRVLREAGPALVRTAICERSRTYPYVPFFPASVPMLEETLPDSAIIREAFEAAGFHLVASKLITQTIAPGWAAYAEKLAAGGDSVLARLRRQDLEDGLAALRRRATEDDDRVVTEPIDLFVFR